MNMLYIFKGDYRITYIFAIRTRGLAYGHVGYWSEANKDISAAQV